MSSKGIVNKFGELQKASKTLTTQHPHQITASAPFNGQTPVAATEDVEMGHGPPSASSQQSIMNDFTEKITGMKLHMKRIEKAIGEIEHLHRQVLIAVNVEEASRLSRLIDEYVQRVNNDADMIRRTIKQFSADNRQYEELGSNSPVTASDLRLRRSQQARLAKKFLEIMHRFQNMQSTYQSKYRQQLERQYLIVRPAATRAELDKLVETEGTQLMTQQIFSMANKAQAQKTLLEMKERRDDILAIEKSIKELHQMFVDMALIVEQQGDLINRIEDHVGHTLEYTEEAAIQMKQAVVAKRKSQRMKWILTIVAIVLLIIIGLTIYLSFKFG